MGFKKLQPEDFELECSTVWSFPKRGNWATHRSDYRGNCSPQVIRNLILRYSKEGDVILDPMVGGGTTLIECRLTGRKGIGIDINPKAIEITKERLNFEREGLLELPLFYNMPSETFVGDARDINFISDNSIDFIFIHPPYSDIIKYSEGRIAGDISTIHSIDLFCGQMEKVAKECFRVLKPEKYCAVLMGDTRRKKFYIPIAYKTMECFLNTGFLLREDIIKIQHNCRTTPFWAKRSKLYNFLLIMHEHIFVFYKP